MHCQFNPESLFADAIKNAKDPFTRARGNDNFDPRRSHFFAIASIKMATMIREKIKVTKVGQVRVSSPPPAPAPAAAPVLAEAPPISTRVLTTDIGPSEKRIVDEANEPIRRTQQGEPPPPAVRPAHSQVVAPGSSSSFCASNANWKRYAGKPMGRLTGDGKWVDGPGDKRGSLGLAIDFDWHEQDDTRRKFSLLAGALQNNSAQGLRDRFASFFAGQHASGPFNPTLSTKNGCKVGNESVACIHKLRILFKRGEEEGFHFFDQFQQHLGNQVAPDGRSIDHYGGLADQPVTIAAGSVTSRIGTLVDHRACLPKDTSMLIFEAEVVRGNEKAWLQIVR